MKKLAIFDMDGVLVDTEPLYMQMNKEFLIQHGYTVSEEDYLGYIGISAKLMWQDLKTKAALTQSVDELIALEKMQKYKLLQGTDLTVIPGIPDLLSGLKSAGAKIALASSSMKKNILLILTKTNLLSNFDYIISGEEVVFGKPHPQIFDKVLTHFSVACGEAVVVEDSTNGVEAAHAAGIYTIGFQNPNSGNQNLQLADSIIRDFSKANNQKIIDMYLI